ncbi:MAG TPA: MmgE/PrpD family protein [Acetobacteraceae bacterium]|nr:MmgE/PrpD family protein [Acetobacteraceae bacterium]
MIKDPAWALAEHVCGSEFGDLPTATRVATRNDVLDTFGCLLGGSDAPGIAELARVIGGWGGVSQSQVVLRRLRLPAPQAAMINASMAHALDFDDTLDHGGSIHPGASVLAASLAVSDMLGGVSGQRLLLAITLGLDVSCRVALASTLDRGWHRTAAMGVFGAAAAAGKLLGLNVEQMVNALGIAFSQAAGNRQCIVDGALTKRLQAGQAASSGVLAALLAGEGFTGAHDIFLGRFGFFELYQPNGHDPAKLLEDLGREFRGDQLSFKPYACGRPQHAILDAAIAARNQLGLGTTVDLAAIADVRVTAAAATIAENFKGGSHKRRPTQIVEAQFALPYLIAAAVVHGRVGITEVADTHNTQVLHIAERMVGIDAGHEKAAVAISLRDGRTATVATGSPFGSPENRLSVEQLRMKFADCARNAVRPLSDDAVREAAHAILHLDEMQDVGDLLRHFV